MGETLAKLTIRGNKGSKTIEAVVDTGATNTTIDSALAKELGIEEIDRDEVVLANGNRDKVGVGSAEIDILGIRRVVPMYIYRENLVGLTTLEAAGLRVNPVTRQLEKVPGKLLRIATLCLPETARRHLSTSPAPLGTLHENCSRRLPASTP